MLYNYDWLQQGRNFPPPSEVDRIDRYRQNAALFDNEHFTAGFRHRNECSVHSIGVYDHCCARISNVIGNFTDIVAIPVLLNYQRFISLKMADLVCGEYPTITGATDQENAKIKWAIDHTNLFEKLYSGVIDLSRFGDAPIRIYKEKDGTYNFCIWDARGWYPIVSQDGTDTITAHCLCWWENSNPDQQELGVWYLNVQIHEVDNPGYYRQLKFDCGGSNMSIGVKIEDKLVPTGLDVCAVQNIRAFAVSGTVFGYDDYMPLDALLAEIITRVSQISTILDKHADPSMTGPLSMLKIDPKTGERYLERGKFYGINPEDTPPQYLVWDGKLEAAFTELETLINQLFILSEMGAALTGGVDGSANAVSGSALRAKMANPLAKARRVSNALSLPIRQLLSAICSRVADIDAETGEPGKGSATKLPFGHISIQWEDGLPDDPREQIENCKLATGENKMIPLEEGLMLYFKKSQAEALQLAQQVREQALEAAQQQVEMNAKLEVAKATNKPGPQSGTGVNPQKKGSKNSVKSFQAPNNKKPEER